MKEYYNQEWKEMVIEDDFGCVWRKVNYEKMINKIEPCWDNYRIKIPSENALGYDLLHIKYSDKVHKILLSSGLDENYISCIIKEVTDAAINAVLGLKK